MKNATVKVNLEPTGFIEALARNMREAANRLVPIDRDEIKAVIVGAGDAPAEIADAVVAYLDVAVSGMVERPASDDGGTWLG